MKKRFLVLAVVFALARPAFAADTVETPVQFSAEFETVAGGAVIQGRLFVGDKKVRMDSAENTTIMRLDQGKMYILLPQQGMYLEQPIDPARVPKTSPSLPGEVKRVPLGKEDVEGLSTDKYRVIFEEGGRHASLLQWLDVDGFPVKVEAEDGSYRAVYRNIRREAQPDSIFELPSDLKKFAMPAGMPAGIPGAN